MASSDLWYAYLLRCEDHVYAGISRDVAARYKQHQSGHGALFTRLHTCTGLIGAIPVGSRSYATRFEKQVKAWRRQKKIRLFEQFGLQYSFIGDDEGARPNGIVDILRHEIHVNSSLLSFLGSYTRMPLTDIHEHLKIDSIFLEESVISSNRLADLIQKAFRLDLVDS